MKKCRFLRARFVRSAMETLPEFKDQNGNVLPEIAIAGRSNVGKSSLINHLFNQTNLARVSSTPGKTQTLNFFEVDNQLILVDLPGYGYAKRPRELQKKWAESIDSYLRNRPSLTLILLLVDARHLPTEDDRMFAEWATHFHKPVLIIFTKCDTLSDRERKENTETSLGFLGQPESNFVHYSIKEGRSRKLLVDNINSRMANAASR